jgi:uncharacterized membrane protein
MRLVVPSQLVFALTLVALGAWTLIEGDFAAVWQPVAQGVPCREALRYACAFICLVGGAGLVWPRSAALAARSVLGLFLLWLLVFKLPAIIRAPAAAGSYESAGETAVAGAWVLYAWLAADRDQRRFPLGVHALPIARVLFALALLAFGVSHFAYAHDTAALVPRWLPAHLSLAYVTGVAYLAAGAAVLTGRLAALAAALAAVQMGLFTVLVWAPLLTAGAAQRDEFVISWTLTAAAWLVADSYRRARATAR